MTGWSHSVHTEKSHAAGSAIDCVDPLHSLAEARMCEARFEMRRAHAPTKTPSRAGAKSHPRDRH